MPVDIRLGESSGGPLWAGARGPAKTADGLLLSAITEYGFSLAVVCERPHEMIVAVDGAGWVFRLDLAQNRYDKVCKLRAEPTAMGVSSDGALLFAGMRDGTLYTVHMESGEIVAASTRRTGTDPIVHISAHVSGNHVLTTSASVCMLWEVSETDGCLVKKHALRGAKSTGVQQSLFTPDGERVITCLKNDTVVVWTFPDFNMLYALPLPASEDSGGRGDREGAGSAAATQRPSLYLRGFAVSRDGKSLAAGAGRGMVYAWDLPTRSIERALELPPSAKAAKSLCFLYSDGKADKVVGVLCIDGTVRLINIATGRLVSLLGGPHMAYTDFSVGSQNHIVAGVTSSGKLSVHDVRALLPFPKNADVIGQQAPRYSESRSFIGRGAGARGAGEVDLDDPRGGIDSFHLVDVDAQTQALNRAKLEELLLQQGEYPAKFRKLIWQFLLHVPGNRAAFDTLWARGVNSAYRHIPQQYAFADQRYAEGLQRLLSLLTYWSPVLEGVSWLPPFVFPFMHTFGTTKSSLFPCFEILATLLGSWCQGWFDFFPEAPLGVLKIVESLLDIHDTELLAHFRAHDVSSEVYAWSMLQNGFADILTFEQWAQLWDHLLTEPPRFMYYVVVAYLVYFRTALLHCSKAEDFDYFFHHDNAVDLVAAIAIARRFYSGASDADDTAACVEDFTPLPKGQYPIFNKHPMHALEYRLRERDVLQRDEEELLRQRRMPGVSASTDGLVEKVRTETGRYSRAQGKAAELRRAHVDMSRDEMEKLRVARKRIAEMQREQKVREINDFARRMEAETRAMESQNAMEMEKIAVELELRRKMREDEYQDAMQDIKLRQVELEMQRVTLEEELERQKGKTAKEIQDILQAHVAEEENMTQALRKEYESLAVERDSWDRMFKETLKRTIQQAQENDMHSKLAAELRKSELERDVRMLELEREMRLARIKEEEMRQGVLDFMADEQRERARRANEDAEIQELTNQRLEMVREQAAERKKRLDRERRKQLLELEIRRERLRELERRGNVRAHEAQLEEVMAREREFATEEEERIRQLQAAAEEQRRRDAELDKLLADDRVSKQEKLQMQRDMLDEIDARIALLRSQQQARASQGAPQTPGR